MKADILTRTLETLAKSLEHSPYPTITFSVEANGLRLLATSNLDEVDNKKKLSNNLVINVEKLQKHAEGGGKNIQRT